MEYLIFSLRFIKINVLKGYNFYTILGTIGAQSYFPCRESFFHEQQYNICVPSCPSWRQEPAAISILIDVVVFLAYFTGFVAAIAVLIISIIRHDSM